MNRQRTILLALGIVFFAILSALLIYGRVEYDRTHFRVGSIPQDLVNQLIPKNVAIESIRPPALRIGDPIRFGNATSLVSIIEYGDFQCEACHNLAPEIQRAASRYGGKVRFVWRDFPIDEIHKDAFGAAVFARCAGAQGRFWEAYDALMATTDLSEKTYRAIATRLNLDASLLNACRRDKNVDAAIRRDVEEARADGIRSAPFLFIGTKAIDGFVDEEAIKKAIDDSISSL